jgi:integrase
MKSHRLRDTFTCSLVTAGISLEHANRLFVHTSIRMTEKSYAAWLPARKEVLDSVVVKKWDVTATRRPHGRG